MEFQFLGFESSLKSVATSWSVLLSWHLHPSWLWFCHFQLSPCFAAAWFKLAYNSIPSQQGKIKKSARANFGFVKKVQEGIMRKTNSGLKTLKMAEDGDILRIIASIVETQRPETSLTPSAGSICFPITGFGLAPISSPDVPQMLGPDALQQLVPVKIAVWRGMHFPVWFVSNVKLQLGPLWHLYF